MKKIGFLVLTTVLLASNAFSQEKALFYTGGTTSYLGVSYLSMGEALGWGVSFAGTPGTFSVSHSDAIGMDADGIKDGGEHSWRYNGEHMHDRFFFTFRLYGRLSVNNQGGSNLMYIGVGPGESRHYFGYDRSQSSETVYVRDDSISDGHTEWEIGYAYMNNGMIISAGLSAIGVTREGQVTFGLGFVF